MPRRNGKPGLSDHQNKQTGNAERADSRPPLLRNVTRRLCTDHHGLNVSSNRSDRLDAELLHERRGDVRGKKLR